MEYHGVLSRAGQPVAVAVQLTIQTQTDGGKLTHAGQLLLPAGNTLPFNPVDPAFDFVSSKGEQLTIYITRRRTTYPASSASEIYEVRAIPVKSSC